MRVPVRLLRATVPPWVPPPGAMILVEHRKFIQSLLGCGKPAPSEGARVRIGGNASGPAVDDRYLVPLCGAASIWQACCHDRHYFNRTRFWSVLGIDPRQLAIRLWRVSGDRRAAERAIIQARQQIERRSSRAQYAASEVNLQRRDRPLLPPSPQARSLGDRLGTDPERRA